MNTSAHWLHNVTTDCHIYAIFFPLATEKTFNSLEIYFISYFFIPFFASLFLDKRSIDDSIHYHFSNNLLVHTYLSTTDYADYYPTQDNVVTWNTNHSIYNVCMQNFHCITPIYSIWQRDKISKWETEYTKNIFWRCSLLRDM